ncbi:MAG: hypothetical protein NVSMB19_10490 [Vulcanimicrobiaceae bacterium]
MEISDRLANAHLLALLAADRLIGAKHKGVPVPGSAAFVDANELAKLMFANEFLALRAAGRIGLSLVEKKILFVKTEHVEVALLDATDPFGDEALLRTIKPENAHKVEWIVAGWFTQDVAIPDKTVVHRAFDDGIRDGVLLPVEEQPDKTSGSEWKRCSVAPGAAAALRPALDALVARWQAFERDEEPLRRQLMLDIKAGLQHREIIEPSYGPF